MDRVVIERCQLRVVRHGGWTWGPDPQALLRSAVQALPALLAAKLSALWPEADDQEIAAVRVHVRVARSGFLAALADHLEASPAFVAVDGPSLEGRLESALRQALAPALPPRSGPQHGPPRIESRHRDDHDQAWAPPPVGRLVETLLLSWHRTGVLAARLEFFSAATLLAWRRALVGEAAGLSLPARAVPAGSTEEMRSQAGQIVSELGLSVTDETAVLRAWLLAAVELCVGCGVAPGHSAVVQALEKAFPLPAPRAGVQGVSEVPRRMKQEASFPQGRDAGGAAAVPAESRPSAVLPARLDDAEVHVASAVPFLLLVPLSRIGYLETLTAAFQAAELSRELPLFAAALAYKVLEPPERGWRRTAAATSTAAVFAGLAQPPPDAELTELSRKSAPFLSCLEAVLAGSLLEGHSRGQPLLLARAGDGLLLADAEGVFPIAWAADLDGLRPTVRALRDEVFLLARDAATPELLRRMDREGLRFLTDAPPARGEDWRPLWVPSAGRWWTNDPSTPSPQLARHAREFGEAADQMEALWQALAVQRPSVPRADDAALDRSLTLAAAVSLGTIAWTLWRRSEFVGPALALERFRDLEARVRFHPRSVRVLLPLGRRYQDLYDHGLLEPVRDAGWLGGRVVEFGGG